MRHVYKYPIINETPCPSGRLTHFGLDPSGVTCVWIAVDPNDLEPTREYAIVGTGHPFPSGWFSAGRAFVEGPFVWHLIERMLPVVEEPLADWEREILAGTDPLSTALAERDRARDIAARLEAELARVREVVAGLPGAPKVYRTASDLFGIFAPFVGPHDLCSVCQVREGRDGDEFVRCASCEAGGRHGEADPACSLCAAWRDGWDKGEGIGRERAITAALEAIDGPDAEVSP